MNTRRFVLRETGLLAAGELLCGIVTVGVFALLKYYDSTVLIGALIGGVLAVANFFFMAVAAEIASDKAVSGDVKGGKMIVKVSQSMRLVVLFALVLLFAKSGVCNTIALVVPLLAASPVLMVVEFFRKAGDKKE